MAHMPRQRRTSFLEDLVSLTSMLPWWVCLFLAAVSYGVFHLIAGVKIGGSTGAEGISRGLLLGIAVGAQYVVPIVCVIAAAQSGIRQLSRNPAASEPQGSTESSPPITSGPELPDDGLYDVWKDASKTESSRPAIDTTCWSKELLNALEWKRFELLCAGYFETLGFKSKVAREGADGGVDIHLYAEGSSVAAIVVQCKAWRTYTVGIKAIRELLGVMTAARVPEGVFVTTSVYTAEARQFAA